MALILQLTDGTTTVDLNDGTNTKLNPGGFIAPPPTQNVSMAGNNLSSDGLMMTNHSFMDRTVSINFQLIGSSADNLATRVKSIESILRKAREFEAQGLGSRVQLKYRWTGATNYVYFNLMRGTFYPGDGVQSIMLTAHTRLQNARITLQCQPLVDGDSETLENHLDDPGFEFTTGTVFNDWTVANATRAVETSSPPEGVNWGKLTCNTSSSRLQISQVKTMTAGHHVFSLTYKINGNQAYEIFLTDSGGTTVTALTEDNTERTAFVTRDSASNTSITAGLRGTGNTSDTDDIILMDKAYLGDGQTAPTYWVSGRSITNFHEDEGKVSQAKVNYVDIEDVAADVLSPLQVRALENEAHTAFWMGARHAGRQRDAGIWHEAQDFANWQNEPSDGAASGGNVGQHGGLILDAGTARSDQAVSSTTFSHTCGTGLNRLLLVAVNTQGGGTNANHTAVTYAGTALTKQVTGRGANNNIDGTMWYMVAPATGTNNVVVTFDVTMTYINVAVASVFNAAQTSSIRTSATAAITGTSATNSATTVAVDYQVSMVGKANTSTNMHPNSGDTEIVADINTGGAIRSTLNAQSATTTTTVTGSTWSGSQDAIAQVLVIKPHQYTAAAPAIHTKTIATPPAGQYNVLIRARAVGAVAWNFGMGYAYGGVTVDPSVAAHYQSTSSSTFVMLNLGVLNVPPVAIPIGTTGGSLTLRLALYADAIGNTTAEVDSVELHPIDQGSVYCSKTSATDVVWADSRSDIKGVYLLNTSDVVQSFLATQVGSPPQAHPEGTRLYFRSDDGAADVADGFKVAVTVMPKLLHVQEA